jgi:alanine racemase
MTTPVISLEGVELRAGSQARVTPRVEVLGDALLHNLSSLSSIAKRPLIPVLKANAYGHGLGPTSRVLHTARAPILGVAAAEADDAALLAASEWAGRVQLLGPSAGRDWPALRDLGVTVALCSEADVRYFRRMSPDERPKAQLLLDTGLGRLGVAPADLDQVVEELADASAMLDGLFLHPARADQGDWDSVREECRAGLAAASALRQAGLLRGAVHLGATSVLLEHPELLGDAARVGISMYGLHAHPRQAELADLDPALRLVAGVVHTKTIAAGDRVGYGSGAVLPRGGMVATLNAGVSHGLDPKLADHGVAVICGQDAPILEVTLEYTIVDVSSVRGELREAVLIEDRRGSSASAESIARATGVIPDHVICRISPSIPRVIVSSDPQLHDALDTRESRAV